MGQTLYAKGIDKYGNETNIASYLMEEGIYAVGSNAYDGDETTYFENAMNTGTNMYRMYIDSSAYGKTLQMVVTRKSSNSRDIYIRDINNGNLITPTFKNPFTQVIPNNAHYVGIPNNGVYWYEVKLID